MTAVSSRLSSGDLNQVVSIQAFAETPDGAGGKTKVWSNVSAVVYATIEPANGGEAFAQGVARNTQFYRVTVRWRSGVTPANRLLWNGVPLNIRTCGDPDGRGRALVMTAESGAAEPA